MVIKGIAKGLVGKDNLSPCYDNWREVVAEFGS